MQSSPDSPSSIAAVLVQVATHLSSGVVALYGKHFYDKLTKRSAERKLASKTAAEARAVDGQEVREATSQMLEMLDVIRDYQNELTKEIRRADRAEYERDGFQREAQEAKRNERTADMFMRQMRAAGRLTACQHCGQSAEVKLSDHLPAEIKQMMEEMGIGYD